MGIVRRILQRCGGAVAALAFLAPSTTGAATQAETPLVGDIACLSDTQRTELVRREMAEFMRVGNELVRSRQQVRNAVAAQESAVAALRACEGSVGASQAAPCDGEHGRIQRANSDLQRAVAHRDQAKADFPVLAASRIQAVRAEYPSCDSR